MKTTNREFTSPEFSHSTVLKTFFIFSFGTLVLGMLTAYVSFSVFPLNRTYNLPVIYPPLRMFWVVWLILYPCMGMAIAHVWLNRKIYDVRGVMIFYISILISNFMFLPISNLSNGNPAVMTLMDINGIFTSILLGWLCSRYSGKAFLWLLPLIIWMPITAFFKISLWILNPVNF